MTGFPNGKRPPTPINTDLKTRAGLGPRLKSYLSSGNLLNLGHTIENEQKSKVEEEWPSVLPIYDETTTSSSHRSDNWVMAMRDRLWKYHDVPLNVNYNAPLLKLTDKCIRLSKENNQLRTRILELEYQNRNLLQRVGSEHSTSKYNTIKSYCDTYLGEGPTPLATKRQHSKSTSDISKLPLYTNAQMFDASSSIERALDSSNSALLPPDLGHVGSAMSISSSNRSDESHDLLPDEEEEFKSRQDAAFRLADYVARQTGSSFKDHYPEIAGILRVPSTIKAKATPVLQAGRATVMSEEETCPADSDKRETDPESEPEHETYQNRTGVFVKSQRRIFSFYPGDDSALESLVRYSNQQRLPFEEQPQPTVPAMPQSKKESGFVQPVKPGEASRLVREDSQSSVVTVVQVSPSKTSVVTTSTQDDSTASTKTGPRLSHSENKVQEKPQGPLAAAIAATARFGKNGKKTVRQVP